MKHFIIEITYTIPAEELGEITTQHRAFLKEGYQNGRLLFSGPQVPRVGGIIVARAASEEELHLFFSKDPYQKNNVASYRYIEFDPVFRQDFLEPWI